MGDHDCLEFGCEERIMLIDNMPNFVVQSGKISKTLVLSKGNVENGCSQYPREGSEKAPVGYDKVFHWRHTKPTIQVPYDSAKLPIRIRFIKACGEIPYSERCLKIGVISQVHMSTFQQSSIGILSNRGQPSAQPLHLAEVVFQIRNKNGMRCIPFLLANVVL
ncbi:MAG: hypothetical protein FJ012_00235 [Chloroflexi bacterium]|nr:hypothetical protein [Chloroflexota bacterium]